MSRTPSLTPRTGSGRDPRALMSARDLIQLLDWLEENHIESWQDGGWGVDALRGELSPRARRRRPYRDGGRRAYAHQDAGRARIPDWWMAIPARTSCSSMISGGRSTYTRSPSVRQVTASTGRPVVKTGSIRPSASPALAACLIGQSRSLTAQAQVLCHSGYEFDDVDCRDLRALRDRFGVQPPGGHER